MHLAPDVVVVGFHGETTSWVLVSGATCAVIDCGDPALADRMAQAALPQPALVVHTHCQDEHCREGGRFPAARILVPTGERERVADPAAWRRATVTTWDDPADWPRTMGRERYGIAGAITRFAPATPLRVADEVAPGDRLEVGTCELRAIALPAHDPAALGYVVERAGRPLACFCGDLIRAPGVLVNGYDLEHRYNQLCLPDLPGLLRSVAALGPVPLLPATGGSMPDGHGAATRLAERIEAYLAALAHGTEPRPAKPPGLRTWRRWVEVLPGCWQIDQAGNCILFIAEDGAGLLVDPGPCDYDNPDRERDFLADLDGFVAAHGLRTIDAMLLTHFHGDHYDLATLVQQRFPGARLVAEAGVAAVVDRPQAWNRPCLLPWYRSDPAPACDLALTTGEDWDWHGHRIEVGRLPGHCAPHALYLLAWHGTRIALTGDTVQSCGESWTLEHACVNGSTPLDMVESTSVLAASGVDLNLGGHATRFSVPAAVYARSLQRMHHALPFLRALVPDGDIERAFRRGEVTPPTP